MDKAKNEQEKKPVWWLWLMIAMVLGSGLFINYMKSPEYYLLQSWQRLSEALDASSDADTFASSYELDLYHEAISEGRRMVTLRDASAEEVDAMVEKIEESRKAAEDVPTIFGWNEEMPDYDDLMANEVAYRNKKFLFRRTVTFTEIYNDEELDWHISKLYMPFNPNNKDEPIELHLDYVEHEEVDVFMFIGQFVGATSYSGQRIPQFYLVEKLEKDKYDKLIDTSRIATGYPLDYSQLSKYFDSYAEDEKKYIKNEEWEKYSLTIKEYQRRSEDDYKTQKEIDGVADELERLHELLTECLWRQRSCDASIRKRGG